MKTTVKWPFNLLADVNKYIGDDTPHLPEHEDDCAPDDLIATVPCVLTKIMNSCDTKTRIRGARCCLRYYRDGIRISEISEEENVSRTVVYHDISVVLEVIAKYGTYRDLIRLGMGGYLEECKTKWLNEGYRRGYFEGLNDGAGHAKEVTQGISETTPIEDCYFSVRAYNCLKRHGVNYVDDLLGLSFGDLLNIRNMGHRSASEVFDFIVKFKELHPDQSHCE